MSHKVTMKTKITDMECLKKACARDEIKASVRLAERGRSLQVSLYGGTTAEGVAAVKLPRWQHEIAVKADGEVAYDNYGGQWGDPADFDKLKQAYGEESFLAHCNDIGYRMTSRTVEQDGTLVLQATA